MLAHRHASLVALALLAIGCSHAQDIKPTPAPAVAKAPVPPPAPAAAPVPCPSCSVLLPPLAMIHFGFDDVVLHEEDLVIVNAIGDYLQKVAATTVTIAGHCDERGTVEYNIALGDRRAQAAKEYLVRLGLDPARARTISYGEARPLDTGHNESAWARNRRAEFQIEEKQRAAK
jgi:peptidoglycan-associated lipoprotein